MYLATSYPGVLGGGAGCSAVTSVVLILSIGGVRTRRESLKAIEKMFARWQYRLMAFVLD